MKKSILFGCVAACALWSTVTLAEDVIGVKLPSEAEMKTAFASLLTTQTKMGGLFDLNQMTVVPKGRDFDITLPAVEKGNIKIPSRTIRLTYAGEFNHHPQYRLESVLESLQALLKDLLPTATFTTETANVDTVWVPAYNIITKNSQNVKGLKLSIPNTFDLSVGQQVSDGLVRPISDTKMDSSYSSDARDITISAENAVIEIPSFSYEGMTTAADITADPVIRTFSSTSDSVRFTIPDIRLKMDGAADAMASLAVKGFGSFENEKVHYESTIDRITSPALSAFVPAVLIPTEVALNLDFLGLEKDIIMPLIQSAKKGTLTDADVPVLKQACEAGTLRINLLGARNDQAGVALTGEIGCRLKNAAQVTTLRDVERQLEPVINAKIVITNLDKISPVPTVNRTQCDYATAQLAALDPKAPDAATQRRLAETHKTQACLPHGGPLDDVRPFLDMSKRVTDASGKTVDTITVQYDNETLTVNGQVLFQKGSHR